MTGISRSQSDAIEGGGASAPLESSRYFAFISYSHHDKAWAVWLHRALETYRVPRRLVGQRTSAGVIPRRMLPIFRDRDELASAADLGSKVNEGLARSANLIVICSPHAAVSRWVNAEVLAYKRLGHAARIFCLIVDGESNAGAVSGREARECFVPALRRAVGPDGELTGDPAEPLAADARPDKDGRGNAKLKLIAGMLGVGFDALKRRELQRRNRRLAVAAGLAAVALAFTTILAISAVIARHDAERRQKQAEELVDFMLGDLNDKLGEVHRLDIMQAVDDKAMAYFSSLPTKDVTDAALTQRVTALEKIGSVRMDQGQIPLALDSYRAASALAGDLVQRAPDDIARKAAHADSLKWLGQAYWYKSDLPAALVNFQEASALLQKVAAAAPDNAEFAGKLAYARNDLGQVLEARGEFNSARAEYLATEVIYQRLAHLQPAKPAWQQLLGDAHNNLGKVALEQGNLAEALAQYRADQSIKAALAAHDPTNHDAQDNLVRSNAILGRALALCGQLDSAVHYVGEAVAAAKALVAFDPSDTGWQEYVGLYSQQLGGLLRQRGQLEAAAEADSDALRVFAVLIARDAGNSDWQQGLAKARVESARLKLRVGDAGAAQQLAQNAAQSIDRLRHADATDTRLTLLAAQAYLVLGEVAAARRDLASARDTWARARELVAPALRSGEDPNALAIAASASLLRDEPDVAQPLISRLAAMGYRTPDFDALLAAKRVTHVMAAEVAGGAKKTE